jgi:sulfite exporter TauE/SafE
MFDFEILISLFSLGLFGGFAHCGFMCGPFVVMQVANNLKNIEIQNITSLGRLKGLALLPYHLGRITTYSFLGLISSFLGANIRNVSNSNLVSAIMLIIGSILIAFLLLKNWNINFSLPPFARILIKIKSFAYKYFPFDKLFLCIQSTLEVLFKFPMGIKGYALGIMLGFIPCGLLYSALIIVATLESPIYALMSMFAFGIATIPSLFISGVGSYFFFNKIKISLKIFTQFILLINMITLIIMAFFQINLI